MRQIPIELIFIYSGDELPDSTRFDAFSVLHRKVSEQNICALLCLFYCFVYAFLMPFLILYFEVFITGNLAVFSARS
jgi:hypothetical protein